MLLPDETVVLRADYELARRRQGCDHFRRRFRP
jgi:hypothetical protein